MKTAVVYARYSSDNQTEQSIEGQLRVCEQYAKNNDILILDTYIDRAMTGTNDNRPDFQRMIKDSSNHEWQYILVYKIDRFSRNKYETAKYKKILKDNGVKLLSAMKNIPDTPEGIILESLLEGMAEYYSAELSQKVKRGMNETRLKGNFTGGHLLYGYKVENHKIIIDEEQAEVVRYIYKQYALGVYVKDIIQHLTQNHIYNRDKPFAQNTIYNILKNEKYFGIFRHNNEVFKNIYPAIISAEIYEQVRHKINLNRYGKRSTKIDYLLRNKLECGYCGKTMCAECGVSKTGKKLRYYKCLGRKKQNGCHKTTIRKEFIEDLVIKKILEILQSPKYIKTIIDKILLAQNNQTNSPLLTALLKEQKQTQNSLNNLLSAVEQGVVNNTTNKRMKDLENKLLELEKNILIEQSKSTRKLTREEISNYYLDALKLSSKLLIDYLINKIIVYDDKIKIIFNTPLKTSPATQGFSFTLNH
ncbi:MAG: recombinase family protein [Eubacteriales bacterium]|nr:recombinase family protein [Eubacteriales bacterium]